MIAIDAEADTDLHELLRFFKALADESRLRMVGILAGRECSVEELATLVGLREPTVSHHLGKLRELELVTMRAEGTTHLYRLDPDALRAMSRRILTREKIAALAGDVEPDTWERKVLASFLDRDGERLKSLPVATKKRLVVLEWLAGKFEPDRRYPEAEVNAIINRHHPDHAALRRALIDYRFMEREGGVYWRVRPSPEAAP